MMNNATMIAPHVRNGPVAPLRPGIYLSNQLSLFSLNMICNLIDGGVNEASSAMVDIAFVSAPTSNSLEMHIDAMQALLRNALLPPSAIAVRLIAAASSALLASSSSSSMISASSNVSQSMLRVALLRIVQGGVLSRVLAAAAIDESALGDALRELYSLCSVPGLLVSVIDNSASSSSNVHQMLLNAALAAVTSLDAWNVVSRAIALRTAMSNIVRRFVRKHCRFYAVYLYIKKN